MESLWYEVGNLCLTKAKAILEGRELSIERTVDVVRKLVDTAIAMDRLNLDWETKSGYHWDKPKSQTFGHLTNAASKGGEKP